MEQCNTIVDTVDWNIGVRIVGSNGREKLGGNLPIIVKILVMDSNHLTDMGMEAFIGMNNTCMGLLAVLTIKKQGISKRLIGGDGRDEL